MAARPGPAGCEAPPSRERPGRRPPAPLPPGRTDDIHPCLTQVKVGVVASQDDAPDPE